MIRGDLGEAALITINGHDANINSKIAKNDRIYIRESTAGSPAEYTVEQLAEYRESISFIVNGVNVTCPKFADVNGELVPASYSIKEGDNIVIRDYYTVAQLIKFMDIDLSGKSVIVNSHRADMDEPVYAGFKVSFEDTDYDDETVEIETAADFDVTSASDMQENVHEDTGTETSTETSSEAQNGTANPASKEAAPAVASTSASKRDIIVIVNGTPVTLKNKSSYIFVDILDFYPFDTKTAGGSDLIIKINDEICTFMSPLSDGDITEIYWQ